MRTGEIFDILVKLRWFRSPITSPSTNLCILVRRHFLLVFRIVLWPEVSLLSPLFSLDIETQGSILKLWSYIFIVGDVRTRELSL
jgi:hypothetical protein